MSVETEVVQEMVNSELCVKTPGSDKMLAIWIFVSTGAAQDLVISDF